MRNTPSKSGSNNAAEAVKSNDDESSAKAQTAQDEGNHNEASRSTKAVEILKTHYAASKNVAEYSGSTALGKALRMHPLSGAAEARPAIILSKFLLCVAQGKQAEAERLLQIAQRHQDNPSKWLLPTGNVTDYSGRKFTDITAYEYAYWAKDTHMCRMLEKYMDEPTKAVMLKRIDAIERDGLKYKQHGVEVTGSKHFDLTKLKMVLKQYVDGYDHWLDRGNWVARKEAWMAVGLAQRDVPVHVINEYCRKDRPIFTIPSFKENTLPREITFKNFETGRNDQPVYPMAVSDTSGLGFDSALSLSGLGSRGSCGMGGPGGSTVSDDLVAICHLDEVRTADLTQSRESLKPVEPSSHLGM